MVFRREGYHERAGTAAACFSEHTNAVILAHDRHQVAAGKGRLSCENREIEIIDDVLVTVVKNAVKVQIDLRVFFMEVSGSRDDSGEMVYIALVHFIGENRHHVFQHRRTSPAVGGKVDNKVLDALLLCVIERPFERMNYLIDEGIKAEHRRITLNVQFFSIRHFENSS